MRSLHKICGQEAGKRKSPLTIWMMRFTNFYYCSYALSILHFLCLACLFLSYRILNCNLLVGLVQKWIHSIIFGVAVLLTRPWTVELAPNLNINRSKWGIKRRRQQSRERWTEWTDSLRTALMLFIAYGSSIKYCNFCPFRFVTFDLHCWSKS